MTDLLREIEAQVAAQFAAIPKPVAPCDDVEPETPHSPALDAVIAVVAIVAGVAGWMS